MNVGVIARVPFDEGTLTGTLTKESHWPEGDWRNSYFVPENLEASVDRAEALRPLVPPGMTMPELALRWILANRRVARSSPGCGRCAWRRTSPRATARRPCPDGLAQLAPHRWDREPTAWSQ